MGCMAEPSLHILFFGIQKAERVRKAFPGSSQMKSKYKGREKKGGFMPSGIFGCILLINVSIMNVLLMSGYVSVFLFEISSYFYCFSF